MMRWTIEGIQEAQAANLRALAVVKPSGAFGRAIHHATAAAHRFAVIFTHVDTGALRAAQRATYTDWDLRGQIFIDPSARNPVSGERPAEYGIYEHARGGEHAFYQRVIDERGNEIVQEAGQIITGALP